MITRYLTSITTTFSPFNPHSGKTARIFLSLLPPNARTTMTITTKILPRTAALLEPATLALKFKDGKEMELNLEKMKIKDIQEEVDRHSRTLRRVEELSGN